MIPVNDVVLSSPNVSRFHAQVERVGQRYRVVDLHSSNGTFVNGERVDGAMWLKPDDSIRIGQYRFVMGKDQLAKYDDSNGLNVDVIRLNKWVRKDLNILQNISVAFKPREFIVVVGQSGGGKSTFVDAVAGYRPATPPSRVLVNDIDIYTHFDAIRNEIGFVPQKDIIHMELTIYQALDYTARLRMPADTTKEERHKRVMEVLEDLDLTHRKDVQVSGLSGGQQKRVSIGVELLTKPGLFFLDEPTSGLDPGTETALMQLMRRLADQGRTIILITHATKNVMLADKVIFLARGGYLAWFGPPEEALEYFDGYRSERDRRAGKIEFDEIYAILDDSSHGKAEDWAKRYRESKAYQKYISKPLEGKLSAGQALPGPAPKQAVRKTGSSAPRQVSALNQFLILSARNVKILTRDRFALGLMLATAPLVSLLDVILALLLGRNPFSFNTGAMANVMITLFLLTMNGVMVGGISQMREIVKEQEVYKRERLVNLQILPYVLSKVWVAALLGLYQAAIYTIVHYLAFDMPGGPVEFFQVYITLLRRLGGAAIHAAPGRGAAAARRGAAGAGAAPERHPHDARAAAQAGVGGRAVDPAAGPGGQHRRQPRARRRPCRWCATRSGRCSTRRASSSSAPTTTSARRSGTRCATCCRTTAAATPRRRSCRGPTCATSSPPPAGSTSPTGARLVKVGELSFAFAGVDDPHLRYDRLADVAGPADAGRRRPARRRARAVPPGARPVRRRRLRRDPGRPHPRRPGLRAGRRRAHHQLRPRARARQGAAPAPGHVARRRPGLRLAARLGRDRHLAVRPDPGGLPPRGHPADAGPDGCPLNRLGNAASLLRYAPDLVSPAHVRAVAQLGSAPRSGRGGRRFKSCQPDSSIVGSRSLCGREPTSACAPAPVQPTRRRGHWRPGGGGR